jgi:hypothetical protein
MTGLSPVHGRHIDRLCRIQSLTGGHWEPAAPRRRFRTAAVPVFHPSGSDRHSANASIAAWMGWCEPIRQPAPAAGANKASPPPSASRTAKNGTGRDVRRISQTSSPGARIMGQNGRRSTERAVIRTARSARALSAYLHRAVTASGSAMVVSGTVLRVQEFDKGRGPVGLPPIG